MKNLPAYMTVLFVGLWMIGTMLSIAGNLLLENGASIQTTMGPWTIVDQDGLPVVGCEEVSYDTTDRVFTCHGLTELETVVFTDSFED